MEKIIKNKEKYLEKIYFIGIIILCIKFFTEKSTLITINDMPIAAALAICFFIKLIFQNYTKRELVITVISGIISVFVSAITHEYIAVYVFLVIFASKDIDIKKTIKICFWSITVLLSIHAIKYIIDGLIGEIPIVYRNTGEPRYTFYMNHPNIVAGLILWLMAQYSYLKYDNLKIRHFIIFLAIFIVTYLLTLSRTTLIASIVLLVLLVISKNIKVAKAITCFSKFVFIIAIVFTIGISYIYSFNRDNFILQKLESALSGRISLLSIAIDEYGVSLLPRDMDLTKDVKWDFGGEAELYLDSIYSRAYIKYGLLYLIWLIYLFTNLNSKNENKNSIFIILFAIIGVTERYIMYPVIGFPLLFFGDYLWSEKKKNKKIILSQYIKNNFNAGPKAKTDIEKIAESKFDFEVKTMPLTEEICKNKIKRMIQFAKKFKLISSIAKETELAIIQSPFSSKKIMMDKFKNKIVIIHDIEGLRNQNPKELEDEINFYKSCDYVIAHNKNMKKFLVDKGIDSNKIYELELFDYLCKGKAKEKSLDYNMPKITYSGNLDKAAFIQQLDSKKMKFELYLYGQKNKEIKNEKIIYKGKYAPDEMPNKIDGNLGLVWDGNFDESDEEKSYKNYTRFNNPHKLSCYIASGMPVIVWKKSAIADFVRENNIGYEISNLYDINKLDFSDYDVKKKNVEKLEQRVRKGYFTQSALSKILKKYDIVERKTIEE